MTSNPNSDASAGSQPRPLPLGLSEGRAAFLLVALAALLHLAYAGAIPLSPQEAYYWQWSRHLDLSYFDHPPAAAWTIRAFTALLGSSERAIRLAALLHSALFSLFYFLAGRRLFGSRPALLAVAAMLLVPIFALGQVIVTPDGPLAAGWVAALYFTVRALDEERGPWLLGAGAAVGLACLGKYTGLLLLPQILAVLLLDRRGRRLLAGPWPYLGVAVAALAFAPVLVWNARHGWVSFGFQFARRGSEMRSLSAVLVGRFLGLQALAVSPLLFAILLASAAAAALRWREASMRVAALFSLPLLVLLLLVSPLHWVKMNWPAPAYPAALLAAAALLCEAPHRYRALAGWSAGVAAFCSLYLHLVPLWPALPFPARDETSAGWKELAARVDVELRRLPEPGFVVGCYYKTASELAYYLPGRPETHSGNVFGDNGLQYGHWSGPGDLLGRQGIVVLDERDPGWCERRAEICRPLDPLEPLTVRRGGSVVTVFRLWRCRYPPALLGRAP